VTDILSKEDLRKMALARRSALSRAERFEAGHAATAHLAALVRPGEAVSLFYPINDEIDPMGLAGAIRAAGGTMLLPAVAGRDIEFRKYEPGMELEAGSFGTAHPPASAGRGDPDLIIAPLAAFDRAGNRIGYGGGYYDRATARLTAAGHPFRFIGIAFACQQVEAVPAQSHDRPLDAVVTENGLISFTEPQ
jgi:5-formyltetrahydrofolate cyclo-ligase